MIATLCAVLVTFDLMTPDRLLVFTFLLGVGAALMAPHGNRSFRDSFPDRSCREQSRIAASVSISAARSARRWAA